QAVGIKSARVRHAAWTGVVVLMLALPAWSLWGPHATIHLPRSQGVAITRSSTAAARAFAAPATEPAEVTRSSVKPVSAKPRWTWRTLPAAIYFLGVLILLARLGAGLMRTRILVKRAVTREGMLTSELCAAPVTAGCWKPVVILPAYGWLLPAAQLDAVLIHENEHARRRDPLVQRVAL